MPMEKNVSLSFKNVTIEKNVQTDQMKKIAVSILFKLYEQPFMYNISHSTIKGDLNNEHV